jgi:uncharacterized protein YfaT (DUF1175 family)
MRTDFTLRINGTRRRLFCSGYFIGFQRSIQTKNRIHKVGFEVLTAVAMNSSVFWDITSYRPVKVNGCFGGIYRLHFQG